MKPIDFPEANAIFAKDQPEYMPLPAHRNREGIVTCCWRLSFWERLKLLFLGRVWHLQLTFDGAPQPHLIQVQHPFRPK